MVVLVEERVILREKRKREERSGESSPSRQNERPRCRSNLSKGVFEARKQ